MPKVSIVITVYNLEKYARRAIESVMNQIFEDIEIIVVNDGSNDKSLDIIQELEQKDDRIRVIDQENRGVSQARNNGLDAACGDWIWFLDGDDFMYPDAVGRMYEASKDCDMVICDIKRVYDTYHDDMPNVVLPSEEEINSDRRISKFFDGSIVICDYLNNKLFRREYLLETGIRFVDRDEIFAEDFYFLSMVMKNMGKIGIVDIPLVGYYQRQGSEIHSYKKNMAPRCERFLRNISQWYNHEYDYELKVRAFRFFYDIIYNDVNGGYDKFEKAVNNKFFRDMIENMDTSNITFKQKIIIRLLPMPRVLYSIIRKRGDNAGVEKERLPEDIVTAEKRRIQRKIEALDNKHMIDFVKNTILFRAVINNYKKIIAISLVAFLLILTNNFIVKSKRQTMILRCNYKEAANGLYPDGTWFNIFEIKSDEVLAKLIDDNNISGVQINEIKDRIDVFAINNKNTIENVNDANYQGKNYYYVTNEYNVSYTQKHKIARNGAFEMLEYISEAYRDVFFENYTEKNTVLDYSIDELDIENYEYVEIGEWFDTRVDGILKYISSRSLENGSYRSEETAQTFSNIEKMLQNFRQSTLEEYRGFVSSSGLYKNKTAYINKLEYKNKALGVDKSKMDYAHDFRVKTIEIYDPNITGVAYIPSIDEDDQFYMNRTKIGIDYLTEDAYRYGIFAQNIQKQIQDNNEIINNIKSKNLTGSEYTRIRNQADKMIEEMSAKLEEIADIAIETDNEYIDYKTLNYLEFKLPQKNIISMFDPFNAFILTIGIGAALVVIFWLEEIIRLKLKMIQEKYEQEEEGRSDENNSI